MLYPKIVRALHCIDTLSIVTGKAFSFLVIPIMLLQVYEAIARYFLKSPTIWTWELALLLYGVHFFMGGAWVLQQDKHVRTDVLLMRMPKKVRAFFEALLFAVIFGAFMYVMVTKCWQQALHSMAIGERTSNEWAPLFWPVKILIAVAFTTLSLQGLAHFVRNVIYLVKGEEV